jgi:hypothetical protein
MKVKNPIVIQLFIMDVLLEASLCIVLCIVLGCFFGFSNKDLVLVSAGFMFSAVTINVIWLVLQ